MNKKILIKPVVSEKSFDLASEKDKNDKRNQKRKYTFIVNSDANKIEVKKAVEDMYEVEVEYVNMVNIKGKRVRWGKYRELGQKSAKKKAIVTLKKGDIDIFKVS